MNRVIGLCVKTRDYPSTFADSGYDVRLIEQKLTTEGGQQVKPDIVIASERQQNLICFDCKGGHNVERDQLDRYETLTPDDLKRWITLHNAPVTNTLCLTFRTLEEKHAPLVNQTAPHPLLILGDGAIEKIRNFSVPDLDKAFEAPISLAGLHAPLSHYPFSDQDEDGVLLPVVLRKLVELALNRGRGGPSALDSVTLDNIAVVESTHPYWDALSNEHRNRLSERVHKMMKSLLTDEPELKQYIEYLESHAGVKVHGPLTQLQKLAQEIIKKRETQPRLNEFTQRRT